MKLIVIDRKVSSYILLAIRLLLPAVICSFLNYFLDGYNHFEIILIPFSLSIILFNFHKGSYNFLLTLILTILFSIATLFVSILLGLGIGYPLEFLFHLISLENKISELIFELIATLSYSIFSPFLIFFWYKKLFKVPKNKFTKYVSYFTCVLQIILILSFDIKNSIMIAIWQFVMLLALQLILYQKELKKIFCKV